MTSESNAGLSELDKAIGNVEKIGKVSFDKKENPWVSNCVYPSFV